MCVCVYIYVCIYIYVYIYMSIALLGWNKYIIGNSILLHSKYSCVCVWLSQIKLHSFHIKAKGCLSILHTHRPIFWGQYTASLRKDILYYQAKCNVYVDVVYILTVKWTILGEISCVFPQLIQEKLVTRRRLPPYPYFAILCSVISLKLEATDGRIS
jgi:hypothetical protein